MEPKGSTQLSPFVSFLDYLPIFHLFSKLCEKGTRKVKRLKKSRNSDCGHSLENLQVFCEISSSFFSHNTMLHLPDSAGSKYTCGNKFSDISQAYTFPPIKHLFLGYLSVCLFKSRWQTMFIIELAVFPKHLTCLFHNKSFKTKPYTLKSIFYFF